MEKNPVTIERDGVTLTFVRKCQTNEIYTLSVCADCNDADYIDDETHYSREEFSDSNVLGQFVVLCQMKDKYFEDLENLLEIYDENEYDMAEALGIPTGSAELFFPHYVAEVHLTYLEGDSIYEVLPESISEEDKRKIAEEYY